MQITDLTLDDFGCFDHARLSGLNDGVNVIAGPQRAGKTTFMEAVRCLGYGVPRDGSVPPATDTYDIGGILATTEGKYRVDVDGHGAPSVSAMDGSPPQRIEDLYADLRAVQYRQLYTISLDELRQTPRRLDDDVSLSEVLLGGAFGNVVTLPKLRDEFKREAKRIGGKHGRDVYELGDPIERIEEGIEKRNDATAQVDEHDRVQEEIHDISEKISQLEDERETLERRQTLADAVEVTYDEIQELEQVVAELKQYDTDRLESFPLERVQTVQTTAAEFRDARADWEDQWNAFRSTVTAEEPEAYLERLLANRDAIETHASERAGYKQRYEQLQTNRRGLAAEWSDLETRSKQLNSSWDDPLDAVQRVNTDAFARSEVRRITDDYAEAKADYHDAKQELQNVTARVESLESEVESAKAERTDSASFPTPTVAGGAVVALVAGLGAGTVAGPIVGVLVTFVVLSVTGALAYRQLGGGTDTETAVQTLEADLRSARANLDQAESTLEAAEAEKEASKAEFEQLCSTLGLDPSMPPADVKEYFTDLQALQSDIEAAKQDQTALTDERERLERELEEVATVLVEIGRLDEVPEQPVESAETLLREIDRAAKDLDDAQEVRMADDAVAKTQRTLIEQLSTWDECPDLTDAGTERVEQTVTAFLERAETVQDGKEIQATRRDLETNITAVFRGGETMAALERWAAERETVDAPESDETLLACVTRLAEEYDGVADVQSQLEQLRGRLDEIEDDVETLRDERAELKTRRSSLRSADDVHDAHEIIDEGRRKLEPLAESYATNRLAEYFLDELHEQYIERTTGPLLDDASEVFDRITDGTYEAIRPKDDLAELDFVAALENGTTQHVGELSRATMEQLFLSLRIARIRQETRPLPVVLDDSFTNFDPGHRERTIRVVEELAETNQVFLLTCHPEVVDAVAAGEADASYWQIENGTFESTEDRATVKQVLN